MRYLESGEAYVAGRVGLARAVEEHIALGPQAVHQRLAEIGRATREALDDLPGWQLAGEVDEACAITSLWPVDGQDVAAVRGRLLAEHRILTTVCTPARAPREMTSPLLRISPHVDCTPEATTRLRAVPRDS